MRESSFQSSDFDRNPLFFQRRFFPMWAGFALGVFADNTLRQALIIGIGFGAITVSGLTDMSGAVPIVGSLFAAAMLIFSSVAGQIADRFETSFLLRLTKFVEVCLMATAALAFIFDFGWLLVGAMFGMGVQSAFFSPVRIGAMPKYLRGDELIRGNAIFNAGLFAAITTGLFIGGFLIEHPSGAKILAICLFFTSLAGWLAIRFAPPAPADAPTLKIDFNFIGQAAKIINFSITSPGVIWPQLGAGAVFYTTTLVTVLLPIYVQEVWSATGAVANITMGGFAVGVGLGALSAGLIAKNNSGLFLSALAVASAALLTVIAFSLGLSAPPTTADLIGPSEFFALPQAYPLIAIFMLTSAALGFHMVPLQAAVQRRAPAICRSRIMAAGNMINAATAFAGSLSVLWVTNTSLSANMALLLVALLQAGVAIIMALRWMFMQRGAYDGDGANQ